MPVRPARFVTCAALLVFAVAAWSADTPTPKTAVKTAPKATSKGAPKAAQKAAAKSSGKPTRKAAAKAAPPTITKAAVKPHAEHTAKAAAPLTGPTETLTCRDGTEDRHARIGVVLIGGKVDSFAYYSKWKPRTCSIYLQRNRDSHSKWIDKGNVTNVSLERGLFMIEHHKGEYRFVFRDVDRERYCGMDGTINGTLVVRKGSERCELAGVMEEGVPLGQAYAHMQQQDAPAAVYGYGTQTAAPPRPQVAQQNQQSRPSSGWAWPVPRVQSGSAWPAPTQGLSD
jgi:hypothetical protein